MDKMFYLDEHYINNEEGFYDIIFNIIQNPFIKEQVL